MRQMQVPATVALAAAWSIFGCAAVSSDTGQEASGGVEPGATEAAMSATSTTDESNADSVDGPSSGDPPADGQDVGAPVDLNVCERLIACATAAVIPVTPLEALYGASGTCWEQFEAMQCWVDCAAQLETLARANPTLAECRQCDDDSDCSVFDATPFCAPSGSCCAEADGCAACGNGVVNLGEECDGNDFGETTCESLGLGHGELTCRPDTCTIDPLECVGCGNGKVDPGEQCDGADLDGYSCESLGWLVGTLRCAEDCYSFDESDCGF